MYNISCRTTCSYVARLRREDFLQEGQILRKLDLVRGWNEMPEESPVVYGTIFDHLIPFEIAS